MHVRINYTFLISDWLTLDSTSLVGVDDFDDVFKRPGPAFFPCGGGVALVGVVALEVVLWSSSELWEELRCRRDTRLNIRERRRLGDRLSMSL